MTEFPEILRGYSGLNIGLIFCGISFLITGLLLSQPIFYTIGGTLFGASLGAFFGRIANIDLNQKTIELNQKTNELYVKLIDTLNTLETQKFISDELSVKAFRRIWHLYHITMIDGNYYWRHTLCDFSQSVLPGCLYAIANVLDPKGNPMTYCVEAGVRGDRLFIIETAREGKEPPTVFIFPSTDLGFIRSYYGLVLTMTWDRTQSISPTILSREPIFGEEETIKDPSTAEKMDKIWYEEMKMKMQYDLFPICGKPN